MKKLLIVGIICLTAFSTGLTSTYQCGGDKIQLTFTCTKPVIVEERGFAVIRIENFLYNMDPGNPMLPAKWVDVLLPPNVDEDSIEISITYDGYHELPIEKRVKPAPPFATNNTIVWGEGKNIVNGENIYIYDADDYYPRNVVKVAFFSQRRQYRFVRIIYSPVQYNPVKSMLRIHTRVDAELTYRLKPGDTRLLKDDVMREEASIQFINWEAGKKWYMGGEAGDLQASYDYVIVTTQATVTGSTALDDFIGYLENFKGFNVLVITEADYGSAGGQERAVNIRNWLVNHYLFYGIKYVLLIGDPDPDDPGDPNDSYGDVPMMMCWPRPSPNILESPTDYFYADLTGSWDSDGDNYYGEWGEDLGVDFTPEVYVGRIPVYNNDYATLDSILNKIINYRFTGVEWRRRIMLPMAISNYANEDNTGCDRTDGLDLPKHVIEDFNLIESGWEHYVLYERSGLNPVPGTAPYYDDPLSRDNVVNGWNSGCGIVLWWAHGSDNGAWRKYWSIDDGDGVPEGAEMSWVTLITSADMSSLTNQKPAFVFQCSCLNGKPEARDNLGFSLLVNGAIATVSSTRVSWYAIGRWIPTGDADNAEIGYWYVGNLISMPAGKALYEAKASIVTNYPAMWMNLFDFNLYGDPSTSIEEVQLLGEFQPPIMVVAAVLAVLVLAALTTHFKRP